MKKIRFLYIPIWFYSNVLHKRALQDFEKLYIPIWFYSNFYIRFTAVWIYHFTFQSGSIQMRRKIWTRQAMLLYIPIWFYSNSFKIFMFKFYTAFTFQSGSIQMFYGYKRRSRYWYFTFQSGSIQICFRKKPIQSFFSLHSNLVLFKWICTTGDVITALGFTFQSGSIQIIMVKLFIININSFTFQSGSIQIHYTTNATPIYKLYPLSTISKTHLALHSNLVLFKFVPDIFALSVTFSLHSNLVLFKFFQR